MCKRLKKSWWCKQLFVLPIIITAFIGFMTAAEMDRAASLGPNTPRANLKNNISVLLNKHAEFGPIDEDYLLFVTKAIDENIGVGAGLYHRENGEIYRIDTTPDADHPPLPLEFSMDIMKHIPFGETGEISIKSNVIKNATKHVFFHHSIGDYVLVWGIRPDYNDVYVADLHAFNWWILGGMIINIFIYFITFIVFKRYHTFYNKRVMEINKRRGKR